MIIFIFLLLKSFTNKGSKIVLKGNVLEGEIFTEFALY